MPDFIAALVASAAFCLAVVALNALTRLALRTQIAPDALAEGGFLQFGGALFLAAVLYRRTARGQARPAG